MFNFLCKPSSFGIRSPAKSCSSTPYAICCAKLTHEVLYQAFLSSFSLCVCPDNTSLSVLVDTKVVLACPPVSLTNVLIIRWDINLRGKPSCARAYRRDNNETSERNCTDERISWESRPDLNPALQIGPVATTHEGYYRCEVAAQEGNFGLGYHLQVSGKEHHILWYVGEADPGLNQMSPHIPYPVVKTKAFSCASLQCPLG